MKTLPFSILTAMGALLTIPTHAAQVTTGATAFSLTKSVTDQNVGGATTSTNQVLGTSQVSKFDASMGVLTGATVNLTNGVHKQTTLVTVPTAGQGTGANTDATASGDGSSSVKLTVPNGVSSGISTLTVTDTCADKRKAACIGTSTSTQVNSSLVLPSTNLGAYVGAGSTFAATHTATSISANTTATEFTGTTQTESTVDWSGNLSATYSYLLHSAQSFNGTSSSNVLNLDFGTVHLGDSVASQAFSIFNLLGDRVRLGLSSISETDASNQFSTNLSLFNNLAAGAHNGYSASFLASSLGSFGASYQLTFTDIAPDVAFAANSLASGATMTLNLFGNVIAPQAPATDVPEPGSLMLLGLGAAAIGLARQRRRA